MKGFDMFTFEEMKEYVKDIEKRLADIEAHLFGEKEPEPAPAPAPEPVA
jgi:hypothetical protein